VIKIDLKLFLDNINNKKTNYLKQRIINGFNKNIIEKFNFIINWVPPPQSTTETIICPSSIGKYFNDLNYLVELKTIGRQTIQHYDVDVPELLINLEKTTNYYCTPHELIEFAGLLALNCYTNNNDNTDNYLNSLKIIGKTKNVSNLRVLKWTGLFSCEDIQALFKQLRYAKKTFTIY